MNFISMDSAASIWRAYREIETGQKLLADIRQADKLGTDPTPIDAFGRRRQYTLGVPSGDNSQRLFDVSPKLAAHMIEAHIAAKKRELADACIVARMELDDILPVQPETTITEQKPTS